MTTALWILAALVYLTFVVVYLRREMVKLSNPHTLDHENRMSNQQPEPKAHLYLAHPSR
ncbi:hypothetical protein [Desulfitobacterium chlororespirans]|uniref:Uncharacterized protein n=1 Tax=Desulfitobacterium chlororespirans DSM 11544 TaxID=1121395 RepID=A0A1M7UZX1_9FIRM|nr:hypothetical protein [Desulfitobacterium chlororespirans]SHN88492.1 hypothetical protein SAMN02745215_05366 [Desulfitobacterium chlororespirans DSM 11544]